MRFLPLFAFAILSGCLDADIADNFVAKGNSTSLSLVASEAQAFGCVVAIYEVLPTDEPPELASIFGPWSLTALRDRLEETAIEYRVLHNATECWSEDIREASGSIDLWQYIEVAKPRIASDQGGNVALFDAKQGIFIAVSG